jgi:hypothetical protein
MDGDRREEQERSRRKEALVPLSIEITCGLWVLAFSGFVSSCEAKQQQRRIEGRLGLLGSAQVR